jgi:hypothetical protein
MRQIAEMYIHQQPTGVLFFRIRAGDATVHSNSGTVVATIGRVFLTSTVFWVRENGMSILFGQDGQILLVSKERPPLQPVCSVPYCIDTAHALNWHPPSEMIYGEVTCIDVSGLPLMA